MTPSGQVPPTWQRSPVSARTAVVSGLKSASVLRVRLPERARVAPSPGSDPEPPLPARVVLVVGAGVPLVSGGSTPRSVQSGTDFVSLPIANPIVRPSHPVRDDPQDRCICHDRNARTSPE